ncbi:bifunctional acetate--CoA ligase family protein/GNAT family N-acetyltransferase [Georgenia wangjunii]|uniref:bifunctional acetate--CoA ligase family protein/GNAT family N-acetyltransferase n=1 Tax=Georgenia wangjunii TaxID=3117730 RepID=UPI002F2662D0
MSEDASAGTAAYPTHWEADVVLRDGVPMHIRPIRPDDADALQRMHLRQSPTSVYYRFFVPMQRLSERDLHRFTHVDHTDRVALVLTSGEEIVAVGRFDRLDAREEAEVAFYVADSEHGRGLGSVLLEHLAAAARERGVSRFTAEVLPGNARMISVFRDAGYEVSQVFDDGIIAVAFDIEETGRSWTVMAEREQHAESRSMRALLSAGSVVVAGLGGDEHVLAEQAAVAARSGGFTGPVHLVGVAGSTAQSLADVTGPVELAVLSGPARDVVAAIEECRRLEVHAAVVLSGGFAEASAEGEELQHELVRRTRAAGMRLVGPASFGVIAAGPHGRLNVTVRPEVPDGDVGLFCQSAAAGVTMVGAAQRRGIGLHSLLSAGNRADVSGNDTMQFWQDDDATRVVAVNLESIGNPRKFSRIARRLSASKPVIAVVSGQTGQVVPPGHTVRTTREPQRALAQMLEQAGVIRVRGVHEMLDLAQLFSAQPLPAGPRLGVLSNSGALTSLVVGAGRAHGLRAADLSIGLPPLAGADAYAQALETMCARDDWDALVVIHAPPIGGTGPELARAIAAAAAADGRTVLACVDGPHGLCAELSAPGPDGTVRTVPAFATAPDAVAALAGAVEYATWVAQDRGELADPAGIAPARARELLAPALRDLPPGTTRRLDAGAAADLLACYGLGVIPFRRVRDSAEAVAVAEELGWPVALKTSDEVLRHRADLGGVRLDLGSPAELREAMRQMRTNLEPILGPAVRFDVQPMAPAGVACVVRGTEDALFGPVVSFGLGGDAVELLDDIAFRIPPLTDVDVAGMIRSVKASPRLFGHRGLPTFDVAALEDVLARVSVLTDDLPEVATIVLNPVLVARSGAAILSAVVEVALPGRADSGRRVLPGAGASGAKMEPWPTAT